MSLANHACACREFRLSTDIYAQDSIELLKQSGIDFLRNETQGIDVLRFAELLMSSGVVLNDEVRRPSSSSCEAEHKLLWHSSGH